MTFYVWKKTNQKMIIKDMFDPDIIDKYDLDSLCF